MTLIIGIVCKDGVVMASDSAASFGKEGVPTIGQQEVRKVHQLSDALLYSSMGAIGMSQVIADALKKSWEQEEFANIPTPERVMHTIGMKLIQILVPYLQTATLTRPLIGDASQSLCKSLVAMPVQHVPCLFSFDYNGAPERITEELPFVAMGSGQPIADPFLALLKRLLWQNSQPTLAEGRLAATWTIEPRRCWREDSIGNPLRKFREAANNIYVIRARCPRTFRANSSR
jgi:20S proteasome alpha/beta subunit